MAKPMYRRRTNRRRTVRRRPTAWYRRRYSVGQLAVKALRGVNYVRGLVNSEMYKFDTNIGQTITDAGIVNPVSNIPQGDGATTRTGNSIFVRALNAKLSFTLPTASTTPVSVRCVVLIDNQQISDTTPSWTDIYAGSNLNTFMNVNTVGRFSILKNIVYVLNPNNPNKNVDISIPMRHHVRYNGSAGTDIQKGALYLAFITNAVGTSIQPAVNGLVRVSYHDN